MVKKYKDSNSKSVMESDEGHSAITEQINLSRYNKIQFNSKKVVSGDIFFAIPGIQFNGEDYIDEAIQRGADLIILDSTSQIEKCAVKTIKVKNIRKFLAHLASLKYLLNTPKCVTAVTGTNGKTSVTYFYKQLINLLNQSCTIVGTTGVISDADDLQSCLDVLPDATTLDAISFAKILNESAGSGVDYACVEASSHGLSQYRLDITNFCGVAFTNLTLDHMEYHKDMDEYFEAKLRLFQDFSTPSSVAVVNFDDKKYFDAIRQTVSDKGYKLISYGRAQDEIYGQKDVAIIKPDIAYHIDKGFKEVCISYGGAVAKFKPKIFAEFQVSNLCAAIGLAIASGFKFADISKFLDQIDNPVGRMQVVGEYNNGKIIIDYAHTPDALQKALESLKDMNCNRILALFGCGGERFAEKRPLMGKIASKYADYIVISDDNPRSEDPCKIRAEILDAFETKNVIEIGDRAAAIETAIKKLRDNDILLIAGKGHEKYQHVGREKVYFSDIECVQEILKRI